LAEKISALGIDLERSDVDAGEDTELEDVNARLTELVRGTDGSGDFPLIVAGNCSSCLGTLAGLDQINLGIVWFDAHGDFHTPETSISGSREGMALAYATQRFVPESRTALIGVRDLDPGEIERVEASEMIVVRNDAAAPGSIEFPDASHVYVHLDIDVLDPAVSPGTNTEAAGGLTVDQLERILREVASRRRIAALAVTNYNPDRDRDNTTRDIIVSPLPKILQELRTTR
jgi:arginase